MTKLARLSLANRSLVILVALIIGGLGVYAIPQLKQQLLPSLSFPMISVVSVYPGASPEVVEQQVTDPIETAVASLTGVEDVTSTSAESLSSIMITFDFEIEPDDMATTIDKAVGDLRSQLPADVDPMVMSGGTDDLPVMALAVSDGDDQRALLDKLESHVVPELEGITDVRDVLITGAREEQVVITPDSAALAAKGLAPTAITQALQANGITVPAGTVTEDNRTLGVQVGGALTDLDDLGDLYLTPTPTGDPQQDLNPVKLSSVADIAMEPVEATSLTRTDGEDSLGLSITMTSDGNAVAISHAVTDMVDDLTDQLGEGARISVIFDQAPYVEKSIEDLTTEGALGLLFAVLVIMIFLLSLRSTLVTAMSIPLSVVIALIALWVGDYSLNMLTLGALTISIGRVVDDSIVVLENIKRHLGYGEAKRDAVIKGVREVAGAVTASTLTTVAVFLPIALVSGMVGELFSSFAVTVTVALLASLLVALTVIPVLAYWFLKAPRGTAAENAANRAEAERKELRSPLQRAYVPVLRFATRFKAVTVVIGVLVFLGTVALVPGLKTNFLDASGQDTTQISQTLPAGTDLATTDAAAAQVEQVLADTTEVESYQVTVGSGNPMLGMGGKTNKASFSVTISAEADSVAVEDELRRRLTDLDGIGEIKVGVEAGAEALGGNGIEVIVHGPDAEALAEATGRVESAVAAVADVRDIESSLEEAAPRVEVTVDRQKAAAVGLSEAAVGQLVAQVFQGSPVGEMTVDGRTSDIVLAADTDKPDDVAAIEKLPIPTAGGVVRLSDLAEVAVVDGPAAISHTDTERSAKVTAVADIADLGAITSALTTELDKVDLPDGTSYEIGGVSAQQDEGFADLFLAMLIAVALVFLIMVATFRSFVQPLILLVSIPFAATGAIGLLRITGTPLGVPALIGMLMLIGIVVTNAIVLIDLINQYRADGMSIKDAVIAGGRRRLRPILMTAVATICALVPMALGLTGSGGFIAQSLAVVVIGGLVSSTLLTLLLVPTLYTIVENIKERFRRTKRTSEPGDGTVTVDTDGARPVGSQT